MDVMRTEYPRPQFQRDSWQCLNGEWEFAFDFGDSGAGQGYIEKSYDRTICVPFCPESKLSGIEYKDFMAAVWYRRSVKITAEQLQGRVLLHFGAVDYCATLWVNGTEIGRHKGGYSSFEWDITDALKAGDNALVVRAQDNNRSGRQPRGKQSARFESHGCDYTRTTGIWQTVWLEFVPKTHLVSAHIDTDYRTGGVTVKLKSAGCRKGVSVRLTASYAGKTVTSVERPLSAEITVTELTVPEPKLWAPGAPELYELKYELLRDGAVFDTVNGYFGIRTVELRGRGFYINGQPVFMRTVLDQGFYPDGIYTAPTDADLKRDIELCMGLGFNGARLHQKVFEERYLYWADRLGYLVWGEHANWGLDITTAQGIADFLPEWLEVLNRDYSHPAIIGWCPFNETWDCAGRQQDDDVLRIVWLTTKAVDPGRPCIDTSGNFHVVTDIYDIHDYEQNPEKFAELYGVPYEQLHETYPKRQKAGGQPFFMSEYGGTWWAPGRTDGWGYGKLPESDAEVGERYAGLTAVLLNNPDIIGFCYTQVTDIEQEQNGLFAYDRSRKFSDAVYDRIRETNRQTAAFEKTGR